MKTVRYRPEDPESSHAEFEAMLQENAARRDLETVLLREVVARSSVTSTANPDGTTTWTFRFSEYGNDA